LEKLHSALVVHRNIKPSKLLVQLDKFQEVVIIDFRWATKFKKAAGSCSRKSEGAARVSNREFMNRFSSINHHFGLGKLNIKIFLFVKHQVLKMI
jgi:serine/threonine protein kinase